MSKLTVESTHMPKMTYFEAEDVLHIVISDEHESNSLALSPNITAELNERNELIGVDILNASQFIRDSVLESVQARMTQMLAVNMA